MKERIDSLIEKYISREEKLNIWEESRNLESDLNFLNEFAERIKKSKFIDYIISPTIKGNINGSFLEKLMKDIRTSYDNKYIEYRLKLFYVTKNMFDLLRNNLENEDLLNDFITLWNYYNDAWAFDLLNEIGSFIGCSHECRGIYKVLNKKLMDSDNGLHE